jgi:cysteine desulfurase / selenocysteine lyase
MTHRIDVSRARAETPGCTSERVHFDNAGASLPPRCVLDAQFTHLKLEARIGGYAAQAEAAERLAAVYGSVARLLGAGAHEVALLESATMAWRTVFNALQFEPGDRIVTCKAEYGSNLIAYLQAARRWGVEIVVLPDDETGQIDTGALARLLDDRVGGPIRLIGISHVPTNGGLVNPAEAVGALANAAGIPYLLDACQSVGQMRVDVQRLGCTFLSATGRKYLRAPRGTGFLYVREDWIDRLDAPMLDNTGANLLSADRYALRGDARRFEMFESSIAGKLGLGAAVDYALDWGLEEIGQRLAHLARLLRERLAAVPGVTVRDKGARKCGIVTFDVAGVSAPDVKLALAGAGITVSVSGRASTQLDMGDRGLESVVRASLHYFNTEAELYRLIAALPPARQVT